MGLAFFSLFMSRFLLEPYIRATVGTAIFLWHACHSVFWWNTVRGQIPSRLKDQNLKNHEKVFEQATANQDSLEEVYDRAAANKAAFDGLRSKIEMQKEQIERLWAHIEAQQELCFDLINEK